MPGVTILPRVPRRHGGGRAGQGNRGPALRRAGQPETKAVCLLLSGSEPPPHRQRGGRDAGPDGATGRTDGSPGGHRAHAGPLATPVLPRAARQRLQPEDSGRIGGRGLASGRFPPGSTRRASPPMREGRPPIDAIGGMSRTTHFRHLTTDGSPRQHRRADCRPHQPKSENKP